MRGGNRWRHVERSLTLSVLLSAVQLAHAYSLDDCIKNVNRQFIKTQGKYLHGFKFDTIFVKKPLDCSFKCMDQIECQSFNYQLESSTSLHACELSNATHRTSSLLSREGYSYYGPDLDLQSAVCDNCPHGTFCVESCDSDRDYECLCNEDRSGHNCSAWKANTAEYDVRFPARSNTSHMVMDVVSSFTAFTACSWIASQATGPLTIFSYAEPAQISQIVFGCDNRANMTSCKLTVNAVDSREMYAEPLGGDWHHVCIKWTGTDGKWYFLVDGVKRGQGSDLSKDHTIPSPGKLVIGQIQKEMVGGFDASKSFVGVISRFNVWEEILSDETIEVLAQACGRETGNFVDWREMKYQGRADVIIESPTSCLGLRAKKYNHALNFITKSSSRYAIVNTAMPDLQSLSICTNLKTTDKTEITVFSYATPSEVNSLILFIYGNDEMRFFIDGWHSDSKHKLIRDLTDGKWHTVCHSWRSSDGQLMAYIDGVNILNTSNAKDSVIRGNGVLVLGQDQKSYGSGFEDGQAFQGLLKDVNLWDRVLTVDEIIQISQGCSEARGNAISWRDLRFTSRKHLPIVRYSDCIMANQSDFMFTIPPGGTDFVQLPSLPSLTRFTVCLWLKERTSDEILKYEVNSHTEMMLGFSYVGTLSLLVGTVSRTDKMIYPKKDFWKHICVTWHNGGNGTSRVFNNGALRMTNSPHAGGVTLKAGGSLRLLNCTVTRFNMWSEVLTDVAIDAMSSRPASEKGDVVAWRDVMTKGFGNTRLYLNPEIEIDGDEFRYQLAFRSLSTSNHAVYKDMPTLSALTFCLWLNMSSEQIADDMCPASYVHDANAHSISMQLIGNDIRVGIEGMYITSTGVDVRDNEWHVICFTWRSMDGSGKLYVDGTIVKDALGVSKGAIIPSGGVLLLGQDQGSVGGGFRSSFVGFLSNINIWKTALADDFIRAISTGWGMWSGDAVSWFQLHRATITGVRFTFNGKLFLPGAIAQKHRDEFCNEKHGASPKDGCIPPLYALLDKKTGSTILKWSCYYSNALKSTSTNQGFAYAGGECRHTYHTKLGNMND